MFVCVGVSSIIPLAPGDAEHPLHHPEPSTYSFQLGESLLVHPVISNADQQVNGTVTVSQVHMQFPGGAQDQWLDYFHPTDSRAVRTGGTKERKAVPLHEYPVYVKRGSLVPLAPISNPKSFSDKNYMETPVVFTWYAPVTNTPTVRAEVREWEGGGLVGTASFLEDRLSLTVSAHESRRAGFDIYGVTEPATITIENGKFSVPCAHVYVAAEQKLSIKCADMSKGLYITATGVKSTF